MSVMETLSLALVMVAAEASASLFWTHGGHSVGSKSLKVALWWGPRGGGRAACENRVRSMCWCQQPNGWAEVATGHSFLATRRQNPFPVFGEVLHFWGRVRYKIPVPWSN